MKVLLLAGTTEAREFTEHALPRTDIEIIASFAGHTRDQRAMPCAVRLGGFGGVDGLVAFVQAQAIDVIVDATHPFSTNMPQHARVAAQVTGTPHARLVRPPWTPIADDHWIDVDDLAGAARAVARLRRSPVLLTIGRLDLASFGGLEPLAFVIRTVEDPGPLRFNPLAIVQARGPFTVHEEGGLISAYGISVLVTRNAGGDDAKLVAARAARLPVVMVRRPPIVAEQCFTNVTDVFAWLASLRP